MTLSSISPQTSKTEAREILLKYLELKKLTLTEQDFDKPWGGYFRIADKDLGIFIDEFFPEHGELKQSPEKVSPKILLVAPQQRLSWQYHHRRAELWKVLYGPVGVIMSETDEQTEPKLYHTSNKIEVGQGIRHRLLGADNWGVIAEIWVHTDAQNPSDENDIVRVEDDYGR